MKRMKRKHEYPMHRNSKLLKMTKKERQYLKSLQHQEPLEDTGFMVQWLKQIWSKSLLAGLDFKQ